MWQPVSSKKRWSGAFHYSKWDISTLVLVCEVHFQLTRYLYWVSCVSVQVSVGWTGGVSLKCLVYVSLEMKETPAPVSSSMKRGVPFSLTGTSMPLLPEPKLHSEVENGSTESWELTWEGSVSSTLLIFCGLLLHTSVMWPALPQEWQV